jgi:hypothetical protein
MVGSAAGASVAIGSVAIGSVAGASSTVGTAVGSTAAGAEGWAGAAGAAHAPTIIVSNTSRLIIVRRFM